MTAMTGLRLRAWASAAILILGATAVVLGWCASSPIGSAPDDNYHQASIWCPTPLEANCAVSRSPDGRVGVLVPVAVSESPTCYKQKAEQSAACVAETAPDDKSTDVYWGVDNGGYPGGYYDVMHVLVSADVERSVLSMRLANGMAAVVLLAATVLLMARDDRRTVTYAGLATCVPLVVWVICSVNPSGWAITGTTVAYFGLRGFLSGEQRGPKSKSKRAALAVLGLVGASMAASARADAGIYIVLVALAVVALGFRELRQHWWHLIVPLVMCTVGMMGALAGGQVASSASAGLAPQNPGRGGLDVLLHNLQEIPVTILGYAGTQYGLGWLDTAMPAITVYGVLAISSGAAFLGLRSMDWPKAAALAGLSGAIILFPLIILQASKSLAGEGVQARYLTPLIPVIVAIAISRVRAGGATSWSLPQTLVAYSVLVVGHAAALHTQIRRYATGLDVLGFNLDIAAEWRPVWASPMGTWLIGSVGFALLATALFMVLDRERLGKFLHGRTRVDASVE